MLRRTQQDSVQPEETPYTGVERRKHPRLKMDTPAQDVQENGLTGGRRREDRRQEDRRPEDRRQGDRRQGDRRSADALRAQVSWTTKADNSNQGILGVLSKRPAGILAMKPSRIFLVLVAIVSGGIAAVLATQSEPEPLASPAQPLTTTIPEARTQILVAKQAVGVGQRLTPASLVWEDWPEGSVRADYIEATTTPEAISEMSGSIARFEILSGEPIRPQKLATVEQGYLSAVLESGMRGVSVSITAEAASGGFILPNDRVDVVATFVGDMGQSSRTVLSNVRVLAINSRLGETGKSGETANPDDPRAQMFEDQAIATLELDPYQAEVIISASAQGPLSLVLLSASDFAQAPQNARSGANAAIRLTSPFWQN